MARARRSAEREARRRAEEDAKRLAEIDERSKAIIRTKPESVKLLLYSRERGMSRATMNQIWGRTFVDAIIGG
jgi:hypothetical protein